MLDVETSTRLLSGWGHRLPLRLNVCVHSSPFLGDFHPRRGGGVTAWFVGGGSKARFEEAVGGRVQRWTAPNRWKQGGHLHGELDWWACCQQRCSSTSNHRHQKVATSHDSEKGWCWEMQAQLVAPIIVVINSLHRSRSEENKVQPSFLRADP